MSGAVSHLAPQPIQLKEPFAVGACAMSSVLTLAVVSKASGRFVLADNGLVQFALEDRTQDSAIALATSVQKWTREYGIETVWLRAAPYAGNHRADPSGYKIEALLQTVPAIDVELINAGTLTSWFRHQDFELGVRMPEGLGRLALQHRFAIMAAVYGLVHGGNHTDGEGRHA